MIIGTILIIVGCKTANYELAAVGVMFHIATMVLISTLFNSVKNLFNKVFGSKDEK